MGGNVPGQRVHSDDGFVDGGGGVLLEIRFAAEGVTAHLEACLLNLFADIHRAVELQDVVVLDQRFFDLFDDIHGGIGRSSQIGSAGFAGLDGFGHVGKGAAVFGRGLILSVHQFEIADTFDHALRGFQVGVELVQRSHDGRRGFSGVLSFIHHACRAQIHRPLTDLRDHPQLVAAFDHRLHARPPRRRDEQRQQ